jgi:hypothetical protein
MTAIMLIALGPLVVIIIGFSWVLCTLGDNKHERERIAAQTRAVMARFEAGAQQRALERRPFMDTITILPYKFPYK